MFHFDINSIEKEIKSLEAKTSVENFWNDIKKANETMAKLKKLEKKKGKFEKLKTEITNLIEMNALLQVEKDEELEGELNIYTKKVKKEIDKLELEVLFKGKFDKNNAIITFHPRSWRN